MKSLKCVLCTDSTELEAKMLHFINQFTFLENAEVIHDLVSCIERLNKIRPEILFIDTDQQSVDMKVFFQVINKPAIIIAITAKEECIAELLDIGCFDVMIMSKLNLEYFCKKIGKIMNLFNKFDKKSYYPVVEENPAYYRPALPEKKDSMFIKYQKSSFKVKYDDILYIKNVGGSLKLYMDGAKNLYHKATLRKFMEMLPSDLFVRINNSTIINMSKVEKYSRNHVTIQNEIFNVSRIYKETFKECLHV